MLVEDTGIYHSPDLKPVNIKNRDQHILNPLSILTFHLHGFNSTLPVFLSDISFDLLSINILSLVLPDDCVRKITRPCPSRILKYEWTDGFFGSCYNIYIVTEDIYFKHLQNFYSQTRKPIQDGQVIIEVFLTELCPFFQF